MLMPAARLGIVYYPSGIERYVSRLGVAAAKRLFLTAEPIDADEMQRIGYLDEIVPAEELPPRVEALAATARGQRAGRPRRPKAGDQRGRDGPTRPRRARRGARPRRRVRRSRRGAEGVVGEAQARLQGPVDKSARFTQGSAWRFPVRGARDAGEEVVSTTDDNQLRYARREIRPR
jgi:enoyl-CoA hydratase/carnithine racemase